jgi:hypothetical protein
MPRRLAWRCDHGSALRNRKAADRPLHWQASSRIDVWSGGVTCGSADPDLLLIADCADGRRVHACVCDPSGPRSKCLIWFNPGSNTRWPMTTTLPIWHSARARTRRRSSRCARVGSWDACASVVTGDEGRTCRAFDARYLDRGCPKRSKAMRLDPRMRDC